MKGCDVNDCVKETIEIAKNKLILLNSEITTIETSNNQIETETDEKIQLKNQLIEETKELTKQMAELRTLNEIKIKQLHTMEKDY